MEREEANELQSTATLIHEVVVKCLYNYGDLNDLDTSEELNEVSEFLK